MRGKRTLAYPAGDTGRNLIPWGSGYPTPRFCRLLPTLLVIDPILVLRASTGRDPLPAHRLLSGSVELPIWAMSRQRVLNFRKAGDKMTSVGDFFFGHVFFAEVRGRFFFKPT